MAEWTDSKASSNVLKGYVSNLSLALAADSFKRTLLCGLCKKCWCYRQYQIVDDIDSMCWYITD